MQDIHKTFSDIYRAFNDRDVDAVLGVLHPDVEWPNGWEGGYVQGREAVREYWQRQWSEIDPTVTPLAVNELPDGRYDVEVRQLVRDLDGNELADATVHHVYTLTDGLFVHMEIDAK